MKTNKYLIVYFLIIIIYTALFCYKYWGEISLLDSSGLGSFLSGLFAPLAFLYLYLSYRQQEKALNKTNLDILEQIKIQNQMLELQKNDKSEREYLALPLIEVKVKFVISPLAEWNEIKNRFENNYKKGKPMILITLKNHKKEVHYFNCDLITPSARNLINSTKFKEEQVNEIRIYLEDFELDNKDELTLNFTNTYVTSIGIPYKNNFTVKYYKSFGQYLKDLIETSSEAPIKLTKSIN
ncbi:hypothetical protein MXM33_04760 [Acinetobacter vivianii]|uniref:hypothetical protein n=1 Tax=Acinetobacter vivianii TaxID=1776742 RepID=UPI002DBB6F26|nr:hypothetical protein [Acinetobacter vivianii]MEB6666337.1 hypothetical protein [Acinetobacter vivianii]